MKLFSISDSVKAKILMANTVVQLVAKAMSIVVKIVADKQVTLEEAVQLAGEVGADFLPQR